MSPSAVLAAEECVDEDQGQQWGAVLCCSPFSNEELLRHQTLILAQDVLACINGLLDIDLATQKEDLSFYPI